jgi:hypothetical protein
MNTNFRLPPVLLNTVFQFAWLMDPWCRETSNPRTRCALAALFAVDTTDSPIINANTLDHDPAIDFTLFSSYQFEAAPMVHERGEPLERYVAQVPPAW